MRIKITFFIISVVVAIGSTQTQGGVYFADANLKAAVEAKLGVTDPTSTDMQGLMSLTVNGAGIQNLTGLQYASNITSLDLTSNQISNFSPLAGLTSLQELFLDRNEISDIFPVSSLTGLTRLELDHNQISNISPLSNLTNLSWLDLIDNQISDISVLSVLSNLIQLEISENPISDISVLSSLTLLKQLEMNSIKTSNLFALSGLTNLETLFLKNNEILDITALSGLTNLSMLHLEYNNISNISELSQLSNLRYLYLFNNQISDLSPLLALTSLRDLQVHYNPLSSETCDTIIPQIMINNPHIFIMHDCNSSSYTLNVLSTLGGSVINPGEGEYVYEPGQRISLTAQAEGDYKFVGWTGTVYSTQNPLVITMDLNHHIQACFESPLDTIYIDDDAAADLGPMDAAVSDPQENGTSEHPFDSIQEAIEVSPEGATLYVQSGIYHESIDFLGKNLRLISPGPNDPNMSYAFIDGGGSSPVVTFKKGEDSTCMMKGFIITRGQGERAGAVYCRGSSPTLSNCLMVGNRVSDPNSGAVYCRDSNAVFINCTISGNLGYDNSAGLYVVNGHITITNSILWDNIPYEIICEGSSDVLMVYSDIKGGTSQADNGNIDSDPLFIIPGCWPDPNDPNTVWIDGDYHLKSQGGRWDPITRQWATDEVTSPCIDAGDPTSPADHEPLPNGDIINMGAYGGSIKASKSLANTASDL